MTVSTIRSRARCSYLTMRRAAYALESAFDEAVGPSGLSATQFVILRALSRCGATPRERLASIVDCGDAELSHGVRGLEERGLVELQGVNSSMPRIRLTPSGRSRYVATMPMWSEVQRRVDLLFGHAETNALDAALYDVLLVGYVPDAEHDVAKNSSETWNDMAAAG